ncbi:hypothetical protein [Streptomyces silvensis]|uniref:Uncharacterized protein n=1 Tax=Streptomyces silvensis TaxID=1765722 RepID=A0A0W7XD00_9ACTN|nr:hypothetical protein [Streptomyces silvensis]KUF20371.1 hypothetical protein AT728_39600 [Streptomyces silvensis]
MTTASTSAPDSPGSPGSHGSGARPAPPPPGRGGLRAAVRGGFGLLGPRHGHHSLSAEQVDTLTLPIGDDGVVVGTDAQGHPAVLGFHRPTPYDALLIGGLWTAQVIALRAAATGARVVVETGRAAAWATVVRALGVGPSGMSVHDVGQVPPQGASAGNPVLVVRDCGMRPPRGRVVSGPWQSVLTLLPYVSPVAPRLIRQARLVGLQRISPDEAAQVGRVLGLGREQIESLPTLADGVTLWCAERDRQYVVTHGTDTETGLLGAARRMD